MANKKAYKPIVERIVFCRSCSKPIVDDRYYTIPSVKSSSDTKYIFHLTPMDCANAEELRKDWYRQYGANGNIKSRT